MTAEWWRTAVIYQVYVRSFQDSDGDGVGDLQGVVQRLDYLKSRGRDSGGALGVDALWLSPVCPAGTTDFGYDVVDYYDIDSRVGSLEAFDRLLTECHARGIRLIVDLVLNHTSIEHPWFADSRATRDSVRRDWYIWRPPAAAGGPPNGWTSVFGGSIWQFDEPTGEYYLHSYFREQADLNWRNPAVVEEMQNVLRFWLERGADGVRLDAVARLIKDAQLREQPSIVRNTTDGRDEPMTYLHPDLPQALRQLRAVFDEFPERAAFGEVYAPASELAMLYGSEESEGLHSAFNHNLIKRRPRGEPVSWDVASIGRALEEQQGSIPVWGGVCWAIGNHDVSRFVSRHDADGFGWKRARAAALLLLSLPGAACIYNGEELGLRDTSGVTSLDTIGRDPQRAPMPWDESAQRGFTSGEPWLPFADGASVAEQTVDAQSMLALYRQAIALRRQQRTLIEGSTTVEARDDVCLIRRTNDAETVLVAVNTSTEVWSGPLDGDPLLLLASEEGVALARGALTLPGLAAAWVRT